MFFVFAHVLSRKAYPEFATYNKNIVFLSLEEHQQFDQGVISNDPRFFWLIELKEILKQEYYQKVVGKAFP